MSAQSTKKKRIGSRRWVGNQNKTSEADEFHVTDSTSVVQHSTPGENTESLNISANPDYSKSETQNPPSPELSKHRKKLGSSRRNKGGQHGKDSATESYDKPREEVEEKTRGTETPQKTQMSLTIQPQQQEELSQRTEHDMSARHDSSLYSAITPDYFSEFQYSTGSNNPETYQESLISKSQNLQANQDEHDADNKVVSDSCTLVESMLEGTHKSDTVQREELTENAHLVGISEVTSLNLPSGPTVDQQMIDQSNSTEIAERYNVNSLIEKESKERHEGTYLLGQDGNLQGNDLESDSHVKSVVTEFSTTPEITTDQSSPRTNTELECSVEQAIFSSPNEHLNLHQVNSAQRSEDAINKECEQKFKPTEMYEINHSSSVTHVTEDAEVYSGNVVDQAEIADTYQSELIVKSTDDSATRQLDSNPDNKHEMHPTKENNFDTLKQTHEDDLYDTKIPQINLMSESHLRSDNVEFSTESEITTDYSRTREHTEPECSTEQAMLSSPKDGLPKTEVEGVHHLEDAVNKVHEQEVKPTQKHEMDHYSDHDEHDKRETDFKVEVSDKSVGAPLEEMDKSDTLQSESSLQTQQSETNAPLDSQPQQNDTDFNSIGNRRKLGSSRRNKGRHRVKESVAESYLRPTEEVVGNVSDNEALETTQMLVAIEKTNQEESSTESCEGIVPATDDNSLYSAIMSDYSSEVQNSNTTNYPETDMESLIPKSENLQEDHDERETDFKVEVSDKSVEATLEEMDQSDTLQSQEDRGTYHSEDGVDKVHEQEVNPTHELDHSSESVTRVATETAEIISGNLTEQAEICDTYQFEFIVKGTDDSSIKQEDLNPVDTQDVHPTKENNTEALEQANEDEDTEKLQISDTERVDSALGHVYEGEASVVEDDIKPSVEQTVHQEKEGILSGDEESESSLQTQQSETNAPLDSQPQQNDTDFNSIGNRRKLGSSRRNKGRHRVKESVAESYLRPTEEVVGNVSDNEALETTQMLVAIEKTNQEESSTESCEGIVPATDDNSLYSAIMSDYSSEVQNSNTTNYPETDMKSLIPKSENLQEDHDERETDFKVEVSDKSVEATLEEMDQSDTLQSQEDRGTYHSEDGVDKVHEQEVNPTHELDHSSESVTRVATEDAEIISGNLTVQAEISDTYQFEFIVKGTDDSSIKQEDLNPVDTQDVHPTKENSIEALEQANEDEDTEKLQIGDTERVDSALGHVYEGEASVVEDDIKPSVEQTVHQEKEGILSGDEESESSLQTQQSETNAPLDSQPQQNDTDFNSIGSRRKLGSTRRNKGRHRVKESVAESYLRPTEEVVGNVSDNEALETTQMLVVIEKTNQEESSTESCEGVVPATDDNSLYSAIMSDYSSEVQNSNTTNYPETDMESLIPKSENLQDDHDEEVKTTHELNHSSESVTQVATEDAEIISGNLTDQAEISDTYQFEFIVKGTDDSSIKQEDLNPVDTQDVHPTKENSIEALEQTNEDYHVYDTEKLQITVTERVDSALGHVYEGEASVVEDDIKPSVEQTVHQEKEGILSGDEESESSLQTQQSETNAPLDSQPQQNDTDFNSIGNRRKLGSSRRNKGRHRVKESVAESYLRPTEEVVESVSDNEALETTQMLAAIERTNQEESSTESCEGVVPATDDNSLYSAITSDYSSEVQNSNTTNYPETDMESLIPKSENLQEDHDEEVKTKHELDHSSESVTQVATEDAEIISGNLTVQAEISDTYQFEFIVKGTDDSSIKQEDLNPVDTQDVHPTKENSIEALEQANEDEDTEKLQISDTERVDSALGHVYEGEASVVEDDIKPSVEQTVHQEKEGILSGDEESESSLQTQQSETNAPLDSQPQQNDTDFNSIGSRRKLGSSRRNKGRHRVKESVADSYLRPTEEVVERVSNNEALETTQMLVAIERTNQEELSQESEHDVVVPVTDDNSLYSAIMSDYSSELQSSNTTNYPETDMESLIPKSENLQEDHDERETDFKVEVSDKSVEATLEEMDQSDTLQSQEDRGTYHSEDGVDKVHEQEVNPTHELDHSSESVTRVATETAEIISGNLTEQAEISDTYQFEFIVKGTDDSSIKQEDLNPVDTQDVHPTKENNTEALEQANEDEDTEKLQISDTERVDSALGHVYEGEASVVEDDIKPSVEQTVHQEKEGILSGDEESESSLQTQQSETNAPLDSQPQQNDTDFNSIGSRRKLGSSQRNKGRHRVKESVADSYLRPTEEVVERVSNNEALETTQMLAAIERTNQEELSQESEHDVVVPVTDDNSLYSAIMSDYSSELQNSNTTNYPETDMESLIPKNENLQEDHDERETDFKVEVSDKSVEATLEEMDQSDTLQSQEDRGTYHSEDGVDKVHEQEVNPTHELDHSSESVTRVATETAEIISGNLTEQAEICDTYQFEFIVKGTDDSSIKQEDLNPVDTQDVHPTKENNTEALEQANEDEDTEKLQIGDTERVDSALGHVYEGEASVVEDDIKPSVEQTVHQEKEGIFSGDEESESSLQTQQSETNAPLDSQPQQNDTDFNSIGNRRKLGSSRRNKGRHRVKESVAESYLRPTEEVVGNVSDNEALETTQMLVAIERTNQEELSQESEHDVVVPVTDDNSLYSAIMSDYSSEVQNSNTTNYPETDMESLIPKSENLQEDHDEEVKTTHELDHSSESVTQVATEDAEIISGNLTDQAEISDTYQFEFIVKGTDDSSIKQEDLNPVDTQDVHPTKENSIEALEQANEDEDTEKLQISDTERVDSALGHVYEGEASVVEDDIKPSVEQTVHQEKEGILSGDEESESSLQTQQSETNAPLDSQPQQNDTDFNSIGNRRKLGSSRRNKGRHRVKESVAESYLRPTEEVVERVSNNEALETTQMLVAIERTNQEELSQESEHDVVVPVTVDNSLYSAIMSDYSSELQSSNTTNYPETDMESLIPKSENLQEDHDEEVKTTHELDHSSESVTQVATEDAEIISGNLTDQAEICDTYQFEFIVKGTDDSSIKQEDLNPVDTQDVHPTKENNTEALEQANEDEDTEKLQIGDTERVDSALGHVYEGEASVVEDDIKPNVEQTVRQEKEGILSGDEESESSLQTQQSETNAPLDSRPQQNDTDFNSIGSRRKLGSSRRNKGRHRVKESVAESYLRPTEEVVGNVSDNEALETTQMLVAIEKTNQEESSTESCEGVVVPVTDDNSLYSAIMSDYSSEVQNSNTTNYPETDMESLIPKSENLQEDHDERETDFKVEVSDKSVEATLEEMDQSDTLQSQEDRGTYHSEDGVDKVHEQEVNPTHELDHSSESVTRVATETAEIISGNLTEQAEICDTYQFEFIVKGTDDSSIKQEDLNPADTQDVHPTKENSIEALEQANEDEDTEKLQIGDTERVDSALGHVYEGEASVVEDDIKPSVEQTVHQEKEGILSGDEESESSLQTQQSETNAPLDSQPQQNDTDFNSIGSRRKLGSSRRNKGRHRVKESVAESYLRPTEEVVERVSNNEALETTQMLVAMERTSQEELSQESEHDVVVPVTDDNSLYSAIMSDYSSEVQNSNTTNYPETDMESLIPKSENLQEDHDEEVKTTHELDHSSESVTQVATEDAEIISGNLTDQAEISDTYQFEFIVKGTDDSSIKQEDLNPVDTQDVHPTKENSIEALEQANEDEDTEKLQIGDTERVDSALGHVYEGEASVVEDDIKPNVEQTVHQEKEGIFSGDEESESSLQTQQSETNAPLDSQPQQNDTDFNSIGSRRKLGSSRRNKGRHRVKESVAESYLRPTEEVVGNVSDNKSENLQEDHDERETDFKVEVSDKSVEATLEEMDQSDTLQSQEDRGTYHSEDGVDKVHEQEVNPTHELDHSPESVTYVATEDAEIISGNLIDQAEIHDTYQSETIVKSTDDSAAKQEDLNADDKQDVHPTKENSIEALEQTNEDEDTEKLQISDTERVGSTLGHVYEGEASVVEDDIKPSVEQTVHQEKEGLNSEVEESDSSLQTLQSGTNAYLDSQLEQNDTNFNPVGSRRKLGSSRRNRGRRHVQDPVAESNDSPAEEIVGNIRDNAQTEGISDQVKENEHVGAIVGISEFMSSSLHPNLTVDQQVIDLSNFTEMPEQDLFNVYSVKEKESKDGDEDTGLLRQDGNPEGNYLVSESHLKLSDIESSTTPEISTEKSSTGEHDDIECVKQAAFSSPKEELSTNEEQEHVNFSQVRGSLLSENVLNEVHEEVVKPTQMQEMHQIDFSSINESLQSEMNALLNSQDNSQDNSVRMEKETDFNPTASRRKLGSSRRNKGRQQVKVSVAKTYHEPKDEFVENARGNGALETTEMLLATDTTGQEEFKQQTNLDLKPVNNEENTEKMLEDTILSQNIIKDYNTEVASSVDVQVFRQDEVGENFEEPTKKDHEAQGMNISQGITHAELFSAAQTNIGTLAPFDIGLKENRAETAVDVPEESGISCNQQQGIQEKTDLDNSENLQGESKQKRRKMGSTRRTQLNREPKEGMGNEDENKESDSNMVDMKFDQMEVVKLPVIVTADVHHNENTKPSLSPVDKEQQGTNVISTVQDLALTVLPPVDPTKENNFEALEQTNEEQQISGIERVDTTLGQVYVIEVEDNIKPSAEQTVHQEKEGFFPEVEESDSSLQTLQSGTNATLDSHPEQNDTNFNPVGSRRKLGSSRRNKGRQHAKDSELQGTNEISTVQDLALMALPPEQSTVDVEPSQLDDFTSTEMHVPSVLARTNTTNTGITGESFVSSYETTQSAQNDEERQESVNLIQDQALKSAEAPVVEMMKSIVRGGAEDEHKDDQANIQELNDVNEAAHNTNLEMKNSSPNLNSPSRRRKMGSTRRNLGSRSKREDLHQQQEVENEATETVTNAGDVKSASFQSIEEKEELQPLTEDKEIDSEQRKEKVFETVEYSHAFESHVKPPPHQEIEENPVSHVQLVETDHQLTPSDLPAIPSTSPTAGGRRRKLGSSRKSRGHQSERGDRITDTQNMRDARSITEESDIKTTEEDSLGLDKISEVDESDKKPPSNISASKAKEHSRPVSEKTPQQVTPVHTTYAEIRLSQESQKTFSLAGSPKGAALNSNSYNVMMVGDSCVGKSSFMRRAQSGKFSLDLPASVGLDSCMWTVVVDGKPVVLHLWDTAGQERFHSITRQIFHKAQAFLLMYDITSTQSFSAVTYWANCIQEGAAENVTILLLGNKSDAERKVKTQEGVNLAREYNFEFMECSAATGENVIHSLETVARMLSQKDDTREETTVLQKEPQQKKSGCC